jgi:hypothetical protein
MIPLTGFENKLGIKFCGMAILAMPLGTGKTPVPRPGATRWSGLPRGHDVK